MNYYTDFLNKESDNYDYLISKDVRLYVRLRGTSNTNINLTMSVFDMKKGEMFSLINDLKTDHVCDKNIYLSKFKDIMSCYLKTQMTLSVFAKINEDELVKTSDININMLNDIVFHINAAYQDSESTVPFNLSSGLSESLDGDANNFCVKVAFNIKSDMEDVNGGIFHSKALRCVDSEVQYIKNLDSLFTKRNHKWDSVEYAPEDYYELILESIIKGINDDIQRKVSCYSFCPDRLTYDIRVLLVNESNNKYLGNLSGGCNVPEGKMLNLNPEFKKHIDSIVSFFESVNKSTQEFISSFDSYIKHNKNNLKEEYIAEHGTKSSRKDIELLKNLSILKTVQVKVKDNDILLLDELVKTYPNMEEVINYLKQSIIISLCSDGAFKFKPLLIVGPKGIGKTSFFYKLADKLNTPSLKINFSGVTAGFVLTGSSSTWSNGKIGEIFNILMKKNPLRNIIKGGTSIGKVVLETSVGISNPIVILDEIDKGVGSRNYDPLSPLHTLLEKATAKEFIDEFAGVPVDASHINWIATANSTTEIPETILDRFHTIHLSELKKEHFVVAGQSIFNEFSKDIKKPIDKISNKCLEDMYEISVGLRDFSRRLTLSFEDHGSYVSINEDKMTSKTEGITEIRIRIGF